MNRRSRLGLGTITVAIGLVPTILLFAPGCPGTQAPTGGGGNGGETPIEAAKRTFPTSLHGDRHGKANFYEAADGFASFTGIPMDDLACQQCHGPTYADGTAVDPDTYTPGCRDCHVDPDNPGAAPVTEEICLGCHSRQGAEQRIFDDVHRAAGMTCTDCHTQREMHGDGTMYASFLSPGASDADCENCHVAGGSAPEPGSNSYHSIHQDSVHCSACHVQSVSSCYNCHFATAVAIGVNRFFGQSPRTGFKMLVNYNDKVHTATFQALTFEGDSFVAIAPFYGHAITKSNITCGDCHLQGGAGNANLQEYVDTGEITVTRWDADAEGADRLVGPTGVIPVPENWQTALRFDFLEYTGDPTDPVNGEENLPLWDFLKTGADGSHMPIGTPLSSEQMDSLINN